MSKQAENLRASTVDELQAKIVDLKKEQFNLRFQRASGELENTARMRTIRREIARIKTVLGQKSATADA